jgi:hypothetical protein
MTIFFLGWKRATGNGKKYQKKKTWADQRHIQTSYAIRA